MLDLSSFESILFARSLARPDSVLFASDRAKLDLSISLRATTRLESMLLLFDAVRLGLGMSVLTFCTLAFCHLCKALNVQNSQFSSAVSCG